MVLEDNKYIALVDADTILYSAAACIQSNPLLVTHKDTKEKIEFKNKTEFNEWLEEGDLSKDDFTVEITPRLDEDISHALHSIKAQFNKILNQPWCKDAVFFIGGEGNYRREYYKDYKSHRPDKPLAFKDCYDYVVKKWKKNVVVCHGEEAEDRMGIEAMKVFNKAKAAKDRSLIDVVMCYVDKDCKMLCGYAFNYNKVEEGIKWIDQNTAWYNFCSQCLKGDRATDNIPGVNTCNEELIEKYGLRKNSKSIGEKGAEAILKGADTQQEMFERVLDVYKSAFGDDWEEQLNMNMVLLWIRRQENEIINVDYVSSKLGITHE